jgi:hypothetical protein
MTACIIPLHIAMLFHKKIPKNRSLPQVSVLLKRIFILMWAKED